MTVKLVILCTNISCEAGAVHCVDTSGYDGRLLTQKEIVAEAQKNLEHCQECGAMTEVKFLVTPGDVFINRGKAGKPAAG